jgi:arsenate reductase
VKKVLVVCDTNSILSPLAEAYMNKFKKCKAEIFSFGIDYKPANSSVIELLKEDGVTSEFNIIYSLNELLGTNFDYILSLSPNANAFIEKEFKAPLKFNYNFNVPANETKENLEELRKEIKQYIERFCKMYLNEYQ